MPTYQTWYKTSLESPNEMFCVNIRSTPCFKITSTKTVSTCTFIDSCEWPYNWHTILSMTKKVCLNEGHSSEYHDIVKKLINWKEERAQNAIVR